MLSLNNQNFDVAFIRELFSFFDLLKSKQNLLAPFHFNMFTGVTLIMHQNY